MGIPTYFRFLLEKHRDIVIEKNTYDCDYFFWTLIQSFTRSYMIMKKIKFMKMYFLEILFAS